MHNHVTLLGNVGRTIHVRETGDTRFARFTLATDRVWRDTTGNRHQATDWHLCTLFGGTVDAFAEHVAKGTLLFLKGSLRTRRYDNDGDTRFITEVRISRWQLLPQGNGQRSQPGADAPDAAAFTPSDADPNTEPPVPDDTDDLTPEELGDADPPDPAA